MKRQVIFYRKLQQAELDLAESADHLTPRYSTSDTILFLEQPLAPSLLNQNISELPSTSTKCRQEPNIISHGPPQG
jgi:hypothetical protein